jgi:hypothetical protein
MLKDAFLFLEKKADRAKFKVHFSLVFKIKMLKNEIKLLRMVKLFFGCGNIRHNNDGTIDFEILDFLSLKNILIPHFLKYPLIGTKYLDFISFKEALQVIDKKEHLREEGINKLYF